MRRAALVLTAIACLGGGAPADVVAVYPSAAAVPANLLRVSLRFQRPQRSPVLPRIALLGAALDPTRPPFVDQELWSPDGRVLTVLFDPARLKTGVAANLALGRVLHTGEVVTLTLDHLPIKQWRVVAPLATGPQPRRWRLRPAPAGSRQPLVVSLGQAIDALDGDLLAVVSTDGQIVQGDARMAAGETEWRFTPQSAWRPGTYRLLVSPALEDACGNAVEQPFETAAGAPMAPKLPVAVPFTVGALL